MPYIDKASRAELQQGRPMAKSGELNYTITLLFLNSELTTTDMIGKLVKAMLGYLDGKPLSYSLINDVIGATVGALMEFAERIGKSYPNENLVLMVLRDFYKTVAVPYETAKRKENGDVGYG